MNCTRRNFLIGGSTTLFLSGYFPKISFASMQKKNLIIISLRGGMDGLTAVPVIGDKRLKKLRKKIKIQVKIRKMIAKKSSQIPCRWKN